MRSRLTLIGVPVALVLLLGFGIPLPFEGPYLLPVLLITALIQFLPPRNALLIVLAWGSISGWAKLASQWNPLIYIAIDLLLLAILARWLAVALPEKRSLFGGVPFARPVFLFMLLTVVLMFSPLTHPIIALGGIKAYVIPLLIYCLAYQVFTTPQQIQRALIVLSVPALLVAAYTFIQVMTGLQELLVFYSPPDLATFYFQGTLRVDEHTGALNFRPFSTLQDAGTAAHFNLIGLFLGIALLGRLTAPSSEKRNRLLPCLGALLALTAGGAVVISAVRVAWISALSAILFLLWLSRGRAVALMPLLAVATMGAITFAGDSILGQDMLRRALTMTTPVDAFEQSRGFGWWYNNLWMLQNTPFGVGMGKAAPGLGGIERFTSVDRGFWLPPPDNLVGGLLVEVGAPGTLLFLGVVAAILVRATFRVPSLPARERGMALGLTGAVLAIAVTGLAGIGLFSTPINLYFWTLNAMLMRLCSSPRSPVPLVTPPPAVPAPPPDHQARESERPLAH